MEIISRNCEELQTSSKEVLGRMLLRGAMGLGEKGLLRVRSGVPGPGVL